MHFAVNCRVGCAEEFNGLVDGVEVLGELAHVVISIVATYLQERVVDLSIVEFG